MSATATGTSDSMRNLSQAKLRAVELRIPELQEQQALVRRINEQLETLNQMDGLLRNQMQRAKKLKRSLIRRLCLSGDGQMQKGSVVSSDGS